MAALNMAQIMEDNKSRVPPQLHSMISGGYSEERKRPAHSDWKKMQNIRVIARFRPANTVEKDESRKHGIRNVPPDINSNVITLTNIPKDSNAGFFNKIRRKEKRMQYKSVLDDVFNVGTTQKEVFKITGKPLINAALNGFNATLFAYGQTGSGKTYSMFGANDDGSGTDLDAMGMIPRAFVYLFDSLEGRCSDQTIQNFNVSIQTLQIYNKRLLDLLNPNSTTKLQIKTDFTNDSIFVKHLRTIQITSAREALAVLIESSKNRIVASHKLNQTSSRSHMLVLLKIRQIRIDGSSTRSNINFGDLAGSENISKAHGKGRIKGQTDEEKATSDKRRKEGISINESLSALTRCINSLVKGEHPGYRDSPLTHVLQDSLGGNSKTTLLVCASPHIYNRSETIRTLRFAATAKEVKNKAKINQTLSIKALQKKIKELTAENAQLKTELALSRGKMRNATGRRSVAGLADSSGDGDLNYLAYSNAAAPKANVTLNYQTARLFPAGAAAENMFTQSRGRTVSLHSNDSVADALGDPADEFQALSAAVSIAEQQMVIESQQYMRQIANLNESLQKEVANSKELTDKTERQNLELDKAEGTIAHLRAENDDKVVKCYNAEKEVDKLEKELNELRFTLKDYKRNFPEFKARKYVHNENDSSDIDRAGSDIEDNNLAVPEDAAMRMTKDSMDIQVETLEKYLSSLGTTQTDLTQFTDKISSQVNMLPEIKAQFTEKYEKTAEFYDDISKKTNNLQSQISSMRFILENLARNYDEDRERFALFYNSGSEERSMTGIVHQTFDTNQQIGDEIIGSKPSCWSSVFYCGGDNDKELKGDMDKDRAMKQQHRNSNSRLQNSYDYGHASYARKSRLRKKGKMKQKRNRNTSLGSYS